MLTVNEIFQDEAVNHIIDISRYSNHVTRKMIGVLNRSDDKLTTELSLALEKLPSDSFKVQRLEHLLRNVKQLNSEAYTALQNSLESELSLFADYEVGYHQELFSSALPVELSVASVAPETVYAAAMARPFQVSKNGAVPMNKYLAGLESHRAESIRNAISLGFNDGEPIDKIVRRIRGSRAMKYEDGLMQAPRYHVEGLVRTAINHTSNVAAQHFFEANSELLKGLVWVSTIDKRTSPVCQSRDGQIFPVNSGPRPPAHINCRSRMSPITKSWKELGIDLPERSSNGRTRASMDGAIPQQVIYPQWLARQSVDRQNDVLGPTRAKLFRGGLSIDAFVNDKGKTLTIAQLRVINSEVFKKLGL